MPTEKFSAFSGASAFDVTDELVGLVAGDNGRLTRDVLNTYPAGSAVYINLPNGYMFLDDAGNLEFATFLPGTFQFLWSGLVVFQIDSLGDFTLTVPTGGQFNVACASGEIKIKTDGIVRIFSKSNATSIVSYTPANSGFWAGASPLDMGDAIDRMASLLFTLSGAPIP